MSRFFDRLRRDRSGQGLVELTLAIPFLLILALGIVEVGRMLETIHNMSNLTREGANAASRGSTMQAVVELTRLNQSANGLGTNGRVIVSRLRVDDGVPQVIEQVALPVTGVVSRLGQPGDEATPYLGSNLQEGRTYFVVEMFLPYQPITPFGGLVEGIVPETLYDRTLF